MSEHILDQRAFKRFLFRSVVWPIFLMAGLCIVLVWQIEALINASDIVARSDMALAQLNKLERDHIDLETGVRGFLITGDRSFLEPYVLAKGDIENATHVASKIIVDPTQHMCLDQISALRTQWLTFAENLIAIRDGHSPGDWQSTVVAGKSKAIMDQIRVAFRQMIAREGALRNSRNIAVRKRTTHSVIITCAAALLVGGFFSYLSKKQLGYLSKVYESALAESEQLNVGLEQRVAERTAALATANSSLAEANTELEAFAYSISHDLRAPMRHIAGFADLLRTSIGDKLSNDDKENLNTIIDTARLAGRMVDDLLAFSRVGRVQLALSGVNMNSLVEQCRRDLQFEMQDRQIEWNIAPLPAARGDAALLKLALQNLISNAVKYTANRTPAKIEIGGLQDATGATYFIRDNGVGFDMEYAHKLFGVFQRLHRAEEFEGTGIGLANARRIIVRHGGRIWADGAKDKGATFFVLAAGYKGAELSSTLRKILLVEDSVNDVKLTTSALRAAGLANDIVVCRDGVEAIEYLGKIRESVNKGNDDCACPCVVLLDLKMPRLDGLEVLAKLRAEPHFRTLPVVMITSSAEEKDMVRSYNLGVNGYVVKPVTHDEFLTAIKEVGLFWAVVNQPPPQLHSKS